VQGSGFFLRLRHLVEKLSPLGEKVGEGHGPSWPGLREPAGVV